jgi:hypothetical protein
MHRSEAETLVSCADCGAEFSVERDRGYSFEPEGALCFDCAVKRGGAYDGLHECWADAPNVSGLTAAEAT